MALALADEPGTPQDETQASYAASFTPDELWLDRRLPAALVQQRATALNLIAPQARVWIDGEAYLVERLISLPGGQTGAEPGTVLERIGRALVVQTSDGRVSLTTWPLL